MSPSGFGERFHTTIPLKVYVRAGEGLPDRLIGFTPSRAAHPVTRPSPETLWYVQPIGPLAGVALQRLGRMLRQQQVPGLDLSDHWELSDLRFEHLGRQPQMQYLNLTRTRLSDRSLRVIAHWAGLRVLYLPETASDAGIASLQGLSRLAELSLDRTRVTDKCLLTLMHLQALRTLDLSGTQVSDDGLLLLGQLPHLRQLMLGGSITDRSAHALTRLRGLEVIDLSETQIHDQALSALATLPHLRTVYVNRSMNDKGVEKLVRSASLKSLDLSGSEVTDHGLKALTRLKNLQELALTDTRITDGGIAALAHLSQLKILELSGTRVTSAGVRNLAKNPHLSTISFSWEALSRDDVLNLSKLSHIQTILLNGVPLSSTIMTQLRDLASAPPPMESAEQRTLALGGAVKLPPPSTALAVHAPVPQSVTSLHAPAPLGATPASAASSRLTIAGPTALPLSGASWQPTLHPATLETPLTPQKVVASAAAANTASSDAFNVRKLHNRNRRGGISAEESAGAGAAPAPETSTAPAASPTGIGQKEDNILVAIALHAKAAGNAPVPSLSGLRSLSGSSRVNGISDIASEEKPAIQMEEDKPEDKLPDISVSAGR